MKRIKLRFSAAILAALLLLPSLCACGEAPLPQSTLPATEPASSAEATLPGTTVETAGETAETEPETTAEPEPLFRNPYTGLETTEEKVLQRPVAVMFNNLYEALPQKGINSADIVYEVLAEGGILRMCGIITDYETVPALGSLRSARPYYVELALANDAVFVHAGGSDRGYDAIVTLKCDDVDAARRGPFFVNGVPVFYRDQERLNKGVAYEHTLFATGEMIRAAVESKGYRTERADPDFTAFAFRDEAAPLGSGVPALDITVPHSRYSVSKFHFNEWTGRYEHTEYNEPHIDAGDGDQVWADNLFILYAPHSLYPGQTVTAYQKIDLTGEGEGVYCWGGERVSLTWKRESQTGAFSFYGEDGEELPVNPGRSYVVIANQNIKGAVTFTAEN